MKRRILGLLMALVMILSLVPATAFATGSVASGTCGAEGDKINQKDVARLRQYIGDSKTYPLG